MQSQKLSVCSAGSSQVTDKCRSAHLMHELRRHVGGDGNNAMSAEQQQSQGTGIIATIDCKIFGSTAQQIESSTDITRCILDSDNVGNLRKTKDRIVGDICHRPAGHVV